MSEKMFEKNQKYSTALGKLLEIGSLSGPGSRKMKIAHFKKLIDQVGPTILKLLDDRFKKGLRVNLSLFKRAQALEEPPLRDDIEEIVGAHEMILNTTGEGSSLKRAKILSAILSTTPQYHKLLQEYYTKGSMKIGLNQKSYQLALGINPKKLKAMDLTNTCEKPLLPMLAVFKGKIKDDLVYAIEPKLDGVRVIITKNGTRTQVTSRSGRRYPPGLTQIVSKLVEPLRDDSLILDGQLWAPRNTSGQGFQEISRLTLSETQIAVEGIDLKIFDILEKNGVSLCDRPYFERRKSLLEVLSGTNIEPIRVIGEYPGSVIKTLPLYDWIDAQWEGLMLKGRQSKYIPSMRSPNWIKIKPVGQTLQVAVTNGKMGTGKNSARLASFEMSVLTQDGLTPLAKVGTGFTEQTLDLLNCHYYASKERGVPLIIQVRAEAVTRSPTYPSGHSIRFPSYLRTRFDREAPNTLEDVRKIFNTYTKNHTK